MESECQHGIKCVMTFDDREEKRGTSNGYILNKSLCYLTKEEDVVRGTKKDWLADEDLDSSQDIFDTSDYQESLTCSYILSDCQSGTKNVDDLDIIEASQPETLTNCHDDNFILSQESNQSDSLLNDLYTSNINIAPKTTQLMKWSPITPYKSVSTPKRIKISLGANYSSNSDLEWSVSMQTPYKWVKANGASINESDTINKVVNDVTPKKNPNISPNDKDFEKTITPNMEVWETVENNKTLTEDKSYLISTLGFETSKNLNRTYVMTEPIPVPIENCDINSPLVLRVGLNNNSDTNDLSLSDYFSASISPTILDGICQVSEVYDKLSDCYFSDEEFDFQQATSCLTASTPVLNKKCAIDKLTIKTPLSPVAKLDFNESPFPDTKESNSNLNIDISDIKCDNSTPKTDSTFKRKKQAKFLYPTSSQILKTSRKSPGHMKIKFDPGLPSIVEVPNESSSNKYPSNTQAFNDFPVTQTTLKELSNLMEIVESVHACKSSVDEGSGYTQFDDFSPDLCWDKTPIVSPNHAQSKKLRTPMIEKVKNPGLSKRLFNKEANSSEQGMGDHLKKEDIAKPSETNTSITMDMFDGDFDYYSEPLEVFINDEVDYDNIEATNETIKTEPGKILKFSTASDKPIQVSDEVSKKAKTDTAKVASRCDDWNANTTQKFVGFSTGAGKLIKVSDEALKKAKCLLDDIPSGSEVFDPNKPSTSKDDGLNETPKFVGFSTGAGKLIKVSDEALKKAKSLLDDIPSGSEVFDPNKPSTSKDDGLNETPKFVGFSTGAGKLIKVSDEALKKAKSLLDDIPSGSEVFDPNKASTSTDHGLNETPKFVGFSNGAGKLIKVSDESLKKAKSLLDAIPSGSEVFDPNKASTSKDHGLNETPKSVGFSTGAGKLIKFSDEALKNEEFPSLPSTCNEPKPNQIPKFMGFSTGSGKTINVSDEALNKAKSLISDEFRERNLIETTHENFEVKTPLELDTKTSKPSKPSPNTIMNQQIPTFETPKSSKFLGFTTGLGKKVTVSDESLQKAKSFLSDELINDSGIGASITSSRNSTIGSFSTVSGKITPISEQSLKLTRQNEILDSSENSKGFSTGSGHKISDEGQNGTGKTVSVTEMDLYKAKSLLLEDSCLTDGKVSNEAKKLLINVDDKLKDPEQMNNLGNNLKSNIPSPITIPFGKTTKLNSFSTPFRLPRRVFRSAKRESPNPKLETEPNNKKAKISDNLNVKNCPKIIKPGLLWNSKYGNNETTRRVKLKDFGQDIKFHSKDELLQFRVDPKTLTINSSNSEEYTFEKIGEANSIIIVGDVVSARLSQNGGVGKKEISKGFAALPSVDATLISEKWIFNHYRWIIWKLAAMELFFPDKLARRYLTLDNVMLQLKLRYDREIDNSQRSALKKIMERDDTPAKTMILCVASICTKITKTGDFSDSITTLELTDGWYGIPCIIDSALNRMIKNGRVKVGQKLIIHGAELVGSSDAYDPLEAPSDVALKISANSTRRARWYAKLGFQSRPQPFSISLSSVLNDGGIVSQINCIIARIYPMQYLERFPDGHSVSRGESVEKKVSMRHEKIRQEYVEELICKIQNEMELKENKDKSNFTIGRKDSVGKIQNLSTGVEIYEAMESYSDFMTFKELLSDTQLQMLENYLIERQESKQSHMCSLISDEISKLEDTSKFPKNREVIPLLRVRLQNLSKNNFSCILTIWRPDHNLLETLKEGDAYSINQLIPRPSKNPNYELQLNSTKKTRYQKINCANFNHTFVPRMLTPFWKFRSKHFNSTFYEVDIVGFLFHIERRSSNADVQKIFIVDHRNVIIQIVFLANSQLICGEEVLKEGNFVAISNLKMQSQILVLYATEVTNITCHPKKAYFQEGLKALKLNIPDPKSFVEITLEKFNRVTKRNPSSTTVNETAIRMQYPVYSPSCVQMNSSFNRSFVSRQPTTNHVPNDGLLIKNPFYVEPNSPAEAVSKRTKEKISLLEKYREPSIDLPRLVSPISGQVRKPFKVPILKKD